MFDNPIVDEVHRTREQLLAKYNGNLRALMQDMQRRTEEAARAGHPVLPTPAAPPPPPSSKKAG